MKVLFVVPPFAQIYGSYRHLYRKGFLNPPLGLCYLAASLSRGGHEARIVDGEAESLSPDEIVSRAREFRPDVLAFTATSVDFDRARQIAGVLKCALPDTPSILGGTHVNIFGPQVLEETPAFDFGCVGDGEDLIVEFADALAASEGGRLAQIPGLLRREDGHVLADPPRPVEKNIDRYPFPARELLRNELYVRAVPRRGYRQTAAVMSSRGCPYSCVYCAVKSIYGGTRVRLRSAENVLDEIEKIVNRLGITHLGFNDDCLTLSRERMLAICEGIRKRGLKFTWEGLSRADLVDRELLTAMRDAGFVRISFGIESGNPEILKVIRKSETLEQIEEAFRIAREVGIVARGSVIIGLPYETRDTVMQTFRFVNRLKGIDQVIVNILQPYPGTEVREMVLRGDGGSRYVDGAASGGNLRRFGSATVTVNDLSGRDLVFLQKYGFLRFYLRPSVIYNHLRIAGWKTFAADAVGFLRSIAGV